MTEQELEKKISKLRNKTHRRLLWLWYIECKSSQEIADELKYSIYTVWELRCKLSKKLNIVKE